MAVTHADNQVILGAYLKNMRKIEALIEHAIRSDNANYNSRLLVAASGYDQSVTVEKRAYGSQTTFFGGPMYDALAQLFRDFRSKMESTADYFGYLADAMGLAKADKDAGAIKYVYEEVAGVIAIVDHLGYLGALRRDMLAQAFYVVANGVTFGSFTADPGNRGTLSVSAMTGLSHMLTGTLIFECEDETVDQPKLKVSLELAKPLPDKTTLIEADNLLNVDKAYEDGPTGLSCTIARSGLAAPTKTGDGSTLFSGTTTIATPSEGDMAGGVLQCRVTRQAVAPIWLLEFFSDSSRTIKVGRATTDGTSGTAAIDVTLKSGTRFQHSTFDRAAAHAALAAAGDNDDDISFDIKTPRKGDRWTRVATNDEVGVFATKLAKLRRVSLPTSGSSQYTESNASSVSVS